MNNLPHGQEKDSNAQEMSAVTDILKNEVSLFHLKYLKSTSNSKESISQVLFTLGTSKQYDEEISNLLAESKRPNSAIWSLYKKLSDGNSIYVIFTPSETIFWNPEGKYETQKFIIGTVERNNSILCETESSVALLTTTRKNELILIPDLFSPEPTKIDIIYPIRAMCALNDSGFVLVTFKDKSACVFDIETKTFSNIHFSSFTRFNPFRDPIISECDHLILADGFLYGFRSGTISKFDTKTFKSIKAEIIPKGKPISVSYFHGTFFVLTDTNIIIRVTGAGDDKKPLLIFKEEIEKEIEAFTVAAISQRSCAVCGRWHMKIVSFTDVTAALKISESFENYLLGCWSNESEVQLLTSRGGTTNILVDEPEISCSQLELLRTILYKFARGESVHQYIQQQNILEQTFVELDKNIINDISQNVGQRIITHRLLSDLAHQCFKELHDDEFVSNLLEISIIRSALCDNFGDFTSEIHESAVTNDINNISNLISRKPLKYAVPFIKILDAAFTEIRDSIKDSYKKLSIGENENFTRAMERCLDALPVATENFTKLCRYYALTHQECSKQLIQLFRENRFDAVNIAIEAHAFTAIAAIAELTRDFSIVARALKEIGPECINPIISFYTEAPKVSCLLEIGKIKEFRKFVSQALASDNMSLAFNLIQEDSTEEDLINAASLIYDTVRNESKLFSLSQAASMVSVGIFCCQAAGQSGTTDQPLNKLKNRAMIYELQKHYNVNHIEIMNTSDLARYAISQKHTGTALAVIGSTYNDRTDEENANLLIEAILGEPMKNEDLRKLLVSTTAAYTIPESLDKVLISKVTESKRRDEISRAFRFANALIHNPAQQNKHEFQTFHDNELLNHRSMRE